MLRPALKRANLFLPLAMGFAGCALSDITAATPRAKSNLTLACLYPDPLPQGFAGGASNLIKIGAVLLLLDLAWFGFEVSWRGGADDSP